MPQRLAGSFSIEMPFAVQMTAGPMRLLNLVMPHLTSGLAMMQQLIETEGTSGWIGIEATAGDTEGRETVGE